jgi:signal transduction histidine kinase
MSRLAPFLRRQGFTILIAIVALGAVLEVSIRDGSQAPRTTHWITVPALAVLALALLARRRFPFAAPALLWILAAGLSFVDGRLVVFTVSASIAGLLASFMLGNLDDAVQARIGLGIVLGSAAIIVYNDPTHDTGQIVLMPVLFAIAWLAGFALRERAEQAEAAETRAATAERERDAAARIAVAEERVRIARELHDVVAHAVSVMVLQVGAVRHNLSGADRESLEALEGVEQTGRSALAEMRRLLGAMRARDDEPQLGPEPGLDHLETLLEKVRHAGLTVQLHLEGEPVPIPRAIDLSAYRIVQEGLTNVLKHAGAARADVTLRYAPEELQIDIHDDGVGALSGGDPGFGLVGIRERVTLYGGEMSAGSDNGGGFRLRTRLPLTGYRT